MNSTVILNIIRFALLVLAQVLIFNTFNFLGFVNPFMYIVFLYWYPVAGNRAVFMITAFLLGFVIDIFSDTLALHSMATLTAAYTRPLIMRLCFGVNYEFQNFNFKGTTKLQRLTFLASLVLVHELVFFSLEILSFPHILLILGNMFANSLVTIFLCALFSSLFSPKNE